MDRTDMSSSKANAMTRGLLYQGLREANLLTSVREFSPENSRMIHQQLAASFADPHQRVGSLWTSFGPAIRIWQGIEDSLEEALSIVQNNPQDPVLVLEEVWRDVIVVEVKWQTLRPLITEAWYPSDDIYVCDSGIRWCLVLTHYDTINFYKRNY